MKYLFLFIIPISALFYTCKKDQPLTTTYPPPSTDGLTMATPNGKPLKSAPKGPIRSALGEPDIDTTAFKLTVTGLVDAPLELFWTELKAQTPVLTDTMLMYCVEGWEVWGVWEGVLVKDLLTKAELADTASHVLFYSVDGYTTAMPVSYLFKYDAMLAWSVNGEYLRKYDGFPLRLIAFGLFGYKWAKWVTELQLIDESRLGYWERRGYSDRAHVPLDRRRYYEGRQAMPLSY